ncbi:protein phosphatase CheZ [Thermosulfuriphilus ammonigenes]|uniref:Protein phosphatase CheZ n=1 Tax=Thermosulfuriphilus ammonigenes TaxID=1936021 RepID=A0A6G7PWK5_9BACT|nr:protein phosphatase CheZ [Thermosulfuriphilus ammonigenes]MBA2847720.1 chemotaxis protein CheZ [Thermosulfuriphilus ammonigenes]QIJ72075.1 protein phosphatase CheZ [Thermosulfuriphilus ammonigenes]
MNREEISQVIEEAIARSLDRLFEERMQAYLQKVVEGEFYKELVFEMKKRIDDVYRSINEFKKALSQLRDSADTANTMFGEASDQLEEIVKATETATVKIMDVAEKDQELLTRARELVSQLENGSTANELKKIIDELYQDTLEIITACAFQDITGQRVKKVVNAIQTVEAKLLELLVETGVKIKEKQEGVTPELEQKAQQAMDLLKGPDGKVSQDDVDSLLEELGL